MHDLCLKDPSMSCAGAPETTAPAAKLGSTMAVLQAPFSISTRQAHPAPSMCLVLMCGGGGTGSCRAQLHQPAETPHTKDFC